MWKRIELKDRTLLTAMMVLEIDLEAPPRRILHHMESVERREKKKGVAGCVAGNRCGVGKVDEDAQPKKGRYRWRHSVLGLVRLCLRLRMCACICLCVRMCACVYIYFFKDGLSKDTSEINKEFIFKRFNAS